jgi:CIC family chloride channel protein
MFAIPASLREPTDRAYGWYLLLGVACGILAVTLPVVFYKMRDWFRALPAPAWIKPAIGGLLVGLLALHWPQLLGGGYASMQQAINGELVLKLALSLALLKILSLSLTVSSGGSGGVFAPTMFIGCMVGSSLAMMLHLPVAEFTVVGMAALFGAAARVPFATLLMVVEMTGGYQLLVPAGMAVMVAYLVQFLLSAPFAHRSLYEAQVPTRAQSAAHYVEDLRNALVLVGEGHVQNESRLGSVDLFSLLKTGVAVQLGDGRELTTAVVAADSPLVHKSVGEISDTVLKGCCQIVAVFREQSGVLEMRRDLVLEENDRVLTLAAPEERPHLRSLGLFRASGVS